MMASNGTTKRTTELGWSKPLRVTPEEHALLSKGFDNMGNPKIRVMGRPRKNPSDKQKPVAFNLSENLFLAFSMRAKERGFKNWQEWLRSLGEKDISEQQNNSK